MRYIYGPIIILITALMTGNAYTAQQDNAVETKIKTMILDPRTDTPVLVLETVADKQLVPIWIDIPEAKAIALELKQVAVPRPLTHDLIRNILNGVGATLQRVTITDIRENTYFAVLTIRLHGQEFRIDSRPSDAIAIALRMKAPTYVSAKVLKQSKEVPAAADPAQQLRKKLGIQAQDLTVELAGLLDMQFQHGVLVAEVAPGSRAEGLGIRAGDVITKINDKPIKTVSQLEAFLEALDLPSQIKLEVIKKGKPTTVVTDLPSGS
jgi:bifunctional DNase/RNase